VRQEVVGQLASGLMQLIGGGSAAAASAVATLAAPAPGAAATAAAGDYVAPWIDTAQCTSCDECIKINPNIFVYDANKKATIKDPEGGPYKDLVKSAERCTARVIHPGLPRDRTQKDVDKLIRRAEKFN